MVSTHSAIYRGTLRHRRFHPVEHAFSYQVFMLYLDLRELPQLFDRVPGWSARRPAAAWFRRQDFLGDPDLDLEDCVRAEVIRLRGDPPAGPIRMLANIRYFGYCVNPVTHYYCFQENGRDLDCVLAEVNNTPWNERHCYLIPGDPERPALRYEFQKRFHVSPFHPLEMVYRWRGCTPDRTLAIHMENLSEGRVVTDATLALRRHPVNGMNLCGLLIRYPLMTFKVIVAIHWQALRLWIKGAPVHSHPGNDGLGHSPNMNISNDSRDSGDKLKERLR